MQKSIAGKGFESSWSTVVLQGFKFFLQFITTLFLARNFLPEDYGKLAVILLVLATSDLIRDFGLSDLQLSGARKSDTSKSNIFQANVLNGILTFIVLVSISIFCKLILASEFFFNAFLIVSVIPALNGFSNFMRIDLLKDKLNNRYWIADLLATLLTSIITLTILKFQPNQLLLVFQLLINAFLTSIFLAVSKGRLMTEFRYGRFNWNVYKYSSYFGFNRIVKFAGQNLDTLLIGSVLGTTTLGLYNKAFQLIFAPLQQLSDSVGSLAISRSLAGSCTLNQVMYKISRYHFQLMLIIIPPLIFLAANPRQVISILFGPNWLSMSSLIPILSLGGVLYLNLMLINWMLMSTQQSIELLRMNLFINSFLVISFLLFSQMGAVAICMSILCVYFLANLLIGFAQSLKGQKSLFFYFDSVCAITFKSILSVFIVNSIWAYLQITQTTFLIMPQFFLYLSTFILISRFTSGLVKSNWKTKITSRL